MIDRSDGGDCHTKMDFIRAFFHNLDTKINFLDELYKTGHRDEAIILCSCYIDWIASALYRPEEGNNFNFVRILQEYGGEEIFLYIHPKMFEDALSRLINHYPKKPSRKWTTIHKKIVLELRQARGRLYNKQELINLLSPLVNHSELEDIKKELWRGTFAAIVYSIIRIPSVHGLGAPGGISFDNTTYKGKQVPDINFPKLHTCLKRIAIVARKKSENTGKWFGL